MLIVCNLLSDMLSQYVEVEHLGQIYVCDKCNGKTAVLSQDSLHLPAETKKSNPLSNRL